jgi:para-aminobenzoate synthetase component I
VSRRTLFYEKMPYTKERFFAVYQALTKAKPHHVLLESGRGGRFSIAGIDPFAIVVGKENGVEINKNGSSFFMEGKPLRAMEQWMSQFTMPKREDLPPFQGGAIGYISYDYARYIEKLPSLAQDDLQLPTIYFLVFDEWYIFDHEKEELWLLAWKEEHVSETDVLQQMTDMWSIRMSHQEEKEVAPNHEVTVAPMSVSMSEEQFIQAVDKVRHYISQGDVFQVNLSVRQSKPLSVPAMRVYEKLRKLNPSPYMGYFHTPEFQFVSGSPELLIKKDGRHVSTRPIAGTRSRGKNEEEDLQLANELIENEKERAEHVMLVDLERNDLGRVCEYGSVEVNEFMVIEKYSHVMHIVSNVRGILSQEKNGYDLIEAVFPGGTITGAPKVRTMEIIEELEPVRRGVYTGSIGWIGFNGDLELNIVIRTMVVKDGLAHVQAGAGVVIDSNPKYEYKESLKKAKALWNAKELAEEGGYDNDIND